MNLNFARPPLLYALALALAAALAGCGGGGNESGPPDELVASPNTVSVYGPDKNTCAQGLGPSVAVYGGTPPYKLTNSMPQGMKLSVDRLQNSGDAFVITFNGTCLQNMPVTVEDGMGRLTTVNINNLVSQQ